MEQTPSALPPQPEVPVASSRSLGSRLMGIFTEPGDVFDVIKTAAPSTANWLVPAVIFMVLSWVGAWLIFSQETITHQLSELTDQAIQKQVEKAHMSSEQAEQARAAGEKFGGISQKAGAVALPLITGFASPFLWGLFLWLAGTKGLKGNFAYIKGVEAVGLSNIIDMLDAIIRTLLIVSLGNIFAAPSLALLVLKDFNPQNPLHSVLAALNVLTFWVLVIRSIGLSRLSNVSFGKAALWVFGIWIAYTAFFLGFGAAMQAIFAR